MYCVRRSRALRDRLIPNHSMDSRGLARSHGVVVLYTTLSSERYGRLMTPPELRVNSIARLGIARQFIERKKRSVTVL